MQVVEKVRALQEHADAERAAGWRIALVPTMGALHAGHLALIEEARRRADRVFVSIFVNPIQFSDAADLDAYPRALDADLDACRAAGVDLVFVPEADEMIPAGLGTAIEVSGVSQTLCGASRPGHFRGVSTIVAKLLLAAKPHVALFGEKDFQQLAVIRRMVVDLNIDVEIIGVPIVREADGLALSSRNQHLDAEGRQQALALVRALDMAEAALVRGERDVARLLARVEAEIDVEPRVEIDYVALCDPETLEPAVSPLDGPVLLALAVFITPAASIDPVVPIKAAASIQPRQRGERGQGGGERVRLIDNRVLRPASVASGSGEGSES